MRPFRALSLLFLMLAFATPAFAQSQLPGAPPQKPIHMYVRTVWPLKPNTVMDAQAYLWTDDGPLSFANMKEVQGSKLHLILMSPDYKTFYHAAPIATGEGEFRFSFQAVKKEPLRVWAIFTNASGRQVVTADINNEPISEFLPLSMPQIIQGETDNVVFTIHFPRQVRAGVPIDGTIYATLKTSKLPFKEMEPIRGSYAYFGALMDDFKTMSEIYVTDPPLPKDASFGGPAVNFRVIPAKEGMMRIVAEIQARGYDMLVPFTIRVAPAIPKGRHVPDEGDPDQIPAPPPDSKAGE
jgi:hypothetical protein